MLAATSVTTALSTVSSLVTTAISVITDNEVLMVMFVAGLVGIGFNVIRKAKASAGSGN